MWLILLAKFRICTYISHQFIVNRETLGLLAYPKAHLVRLRNSRPSAWYVRLHERLSGWAPRARAASPLRPPNPRATDLNCRVEWMAMFCFYKNYKNGEPKCKQFKNLKIWIWFRWAFSGNIDVWWTTNPQGPSRSHESAGSFLVPQTSILTCQCLIWEKNLALALEIVTYMDLDHSWICCCEIRTLLTSTSHHFKPFCDWQWLSHVRVMVATDLKPLHFWCSKGQSAEEPLGKFLAIMLMSTPWKLSLPGQNILRHSYSMFKLALATTHPNQTVSWTSDPNPCRIVL